MTHIPEGYMQDGQGRLVPTDQVRPIDRQRDETVREIAAKAKEMNKMLAMLKERMMDDVQAFIDLSLERYDVKTGGAKGNVTLLSFDQSLKVVRQVQDAITFDEGLQAAKALIDECIKGWTEGSPSELRALVDNAFQVDKEGRIATGRILNLRRLNIKDEKWLKAMEAISDSIQVTGSKPYIRVYERNAKGGYDPIPLDLAAI